MEENPLSTDSFPCFVSAARRDILKGGEKGGKFSTIRFWFAIIIIIVISTLGMIFYLSTDFHIGHLFWVIFFFSPFPFYPS